MALSERSIPAHTGKPCPSTTAPQSKKVYPRPHGEATGIATRRQSVDGLSPPTRGSRRRGGPGRRRGGSIPAHTGKPRPVPQSNRRRAVYPRPHGEADQQPRHVAQVCGLSPPTRGSREETLLRPSAFWSIPAHTGKPCAVTGPPVAAWVYPRPHGEALYAKGFSRVGCGLSPPTRGSRGARAGRDDRLRSIPAHTGKPTPTPTRTAAWRVYPRPHGEAEKVVVVDDFHWGLSPPTRGSQRLRLRRRECAGSIPAHTGKPPCWPTTGEPRRVYPRPHGEAGSGDGLHVGEQGLSPPTRGSRWRPGDGRAWQRSIPAHTGKPPATAGWPLSGTVYPRPHGEA